MISHDTGVVTCQRDVRNTSLELSASIAVLQMLPTGNQSNSHRHLTVLHCVEISVMIGLLLVWMI